MKVLFVCSGNKLETNLAAQCFVFEQAESLRKKNIQVDQFFIRGKGALGYLKNIIPLRKKIKSENYDIVHAHYGLSGMIAVLQRKTPTIITFHGSDVNKKIIRLISNIASELSAGNIFVSEKLYNKMYIKPKDYDIIPCGVDTKIFKPIEKQTAKDAMKIEKNKKYVLFCSSFSNKSKNYELAKKAMTLVKDAELKELKGFSREEVSLLLNAADLVLMTSKNEGSPQVIKEAMACNCPIVSTDVGDVKNVISNTEGCYITSFEPRDVANKIKKAIEFGKRTNGSDKITEFNSDKIVDNILKFYKKTIEKK